MIMSAEPSVMSSLICRRKLQFPAKPALLLLALNWNPWLPKPRPYPLMEMAIRPRLQSLPLHCTLVYFVWDVLCPCYLSSPHNIEVRLLPILGEKALYHHKAERKVDRGRTSKVCWSFEAVWSSLATNRRWVMV